MDYRRFAETFLDNVRVPKANLVYELNKGWTVGKRLLQHERSMIGGIGGGQKTTTLEKNMHGNTLVLMRLEKSPMRRYEAKFLPIG